MMRKARVLAYGMSVTGSLYSAALWVTGQTSWTGSGGLDWAPCGKDASKASSSLNVTQQLVLSKGPVPMSTSPSPGGILTLLQAQIGLPQYEASDMLLGTVVSWPSEQFTSCSAALQRQDGGHGRRVSDVNDTLADNRQRAPQLSHWWTPIPSNIWLASCMILADINTQAYGFLSEIPKDNVPEMLWSLLLSVVCGFAAAAISSQRDRHWLLWKKLHFKVYSQQIEESGRRRIWEENLEMIDGHNLEASLGLHTYELAMNHLGDLTAEEITSTLMGTSVPPSLERGPLSLNLVRLNTSLPLSLDWRDKGLVTPVKMQVSAVGALEGQLKKSTGVLLSLSPQNLLDCSRKCGNNGCKDGFMSNAFQYVMKNQGIDSDVDYPYTGMRGQCGYNPHHRAANCSGYAFLPEGDEFALREALATVGPISVAIDASRPKFVFYRHGVYRDNTCTHEVNHGVLVVGYGTERQHDYWLIKNSWGVKYGDQGYIKMARNRRNQCGVALYACYPIM
ncbi:Cathepsin S [Liparis tanakae]|uniref:Cathepsin S n=1 Tax=Liparis tanakae TaxID=230148 RepID=A0A4Z2I311_9TELE|nr:Cathepsin S [Liparis tanakae]